MSDVNAGTLAKAEAYAAFAKDAGWEPVIAVEGDAITCTTTRNSESVVLQWQGTRFVDGSARYTNGSQALLLRNVAHARQKMGESADVAAQAATTAVIRKGRGRKAAAIDPDDENAVATARARLPFDANTSTDEEVFAALGGKTITWRNRRTKELERATVAINPGEKLLKIDVKGSRRVLSFCAVAGMFRSVYLDAILEVK